jgi:hypothetical protein
MGLTWHGAIPERFGVASHTDGVLPLPFGVGLDSLMIGIRFSNRQGGGTLGGTRNRGWGYGRLQLVARSPGQGGVHDTVPRFVLSPSLSNFKLFLDLLVLPQNEDLRSS